MICSFFIQYFYPVDAIDYRLMAFQFSAMAGLFQEIISAF
jgi:hypothetical protein